MATKEPKRKRGRPATGKAPKRYFRMEDETWEVVQKAADVSGQTVSAFVRDSILKTAKRRLAE
jgi:uncharacterized protein (DUF1778 family)